MKDKDMEFYKEYSKAWERMGPSSTHVMQWVLRFAQYDLGKLSQGDWMNLLYEFCVFGQEGISEDHPFTGTPIYLTKTASSYKETYISYPPKLPPKEDVMQFQSWVRTTIDAVIDRQPITFNYSSLDVHLIPPEGDSDNRWNRKISSEEPGVAYGYALEHLFLWFGHRIRRCSGCQVIFLADRSNQQFCTSNCQSRNYMRIAKGISPERYGKRGRPPGTGKKKEEPSKKRGGLSHGKKIK